MPTNPPEQSAPRKLAKKRSIGSIIGQSILVLFVAGLAIGSCVMTYQQLISLKDDIWLHWFGVLAVNPEQGYIWHGVRTASKYCVHYKTPQGQEHEKCTEIPLHFFEPNTDRPLIVHYNPSSPDHASTSWGLQPLVLIERILFVLVSCVFSLLLLGGSIVGAIMTISGTN